MRIFHVVGVKCLCTSANENSAAYEDLFPMFDFARYGKKDHIAKHDDRAVIPFGTGESGGYSQEEAEDADECNYYSRAVAGVLYLTNTWKASYGGAFVDLEAHTDTVGRKRSRGDASGSGGKGGTTQKKISPQFNRLVLFRVPR
jgi:hypothetical protein